MRNSHVAIEREYSNPDVPAAMRMRNEQNRTNTVRLLPVVAGLIWSATAVPVEMRAPALADVYWRFNGTDIVANLLLYLPLGLVGAGTWSRIVGLACALSASAEMTQLIAAGRYPGLNDVIANVCGAGLGWAIAQRMRRNWGICLLHVPLTTPARVMSAAATLAIAVAVVPHGPMSDLSNWEPGYGVVLGMEPDRDRRWEGTIQDVRLWPQALRDMPEGLASSALPDPAVAIATPATGVFLADGERFLRQAIASGKFTVATRMRPANVDQGGPARIVTSSEGLFLRNFTLGQEGPVIVFRLRTPVSGLNGLAPGTKSLPVLAAQVDTDVAASYDGRIVRLFKDGVLVGRSNLAAHRSRVPFLADTGLMLTGTATGSFAMLALVGLFRSIFAAWIVAAVWGVGILLAARADSGLPQLMLPLLLAVAAGAVLVALTSSSRRIPELRRFSE